MSPKLIKKTNVSIYQIHETLATAKQSTEPEKKNRGGMNSFHEKLIPNQCNISNLTKLNNTWEIWTLPWLTGWKKYPTTPPVAPVVETGGARSKTPLTLSHIMKPNTIVILSCQIYRKKAQKQCSCHIQSSPLKSWGPKMLPQCRHLSETDLPVWCKLTQTKLEKWNASGMCHYYEIKKCRNVVLVSGLERFLFTFGAKPGGKTPKLSWLNPGVPGRIQVRKSRELCEVLQHKTQPQGCPEQDKTGLS